MKPIERRAVLLFGDLLDGLTEIQSEFDFYHRLCVLTGRPVLQWAELSGSVFQDKTICVLCAEGTRTEDGELCIYGNLEYAWDCITDVAETLDIPLWDGFTLFKYQLSTKDIRKLIMRIIKGGKNID